MKAALTLDNAPDLLKVDEAAQILRIGRNKAYESVRSGEIRCIRIGGTIRIPKAVIRAMIELPSHLQAA